MVDTDWDGTPDALLPGTSNFMTSRRAGEKSTELCAESIDAHAVTEPGPLPSAEGEE
jgi:hypothetical protein